MVDRRQTLDQGRARHAWDLVQSVQDDETFRTQVKKLPTRIRAAGMGQALAFLEGKGYLPELRVGLSDWVLKHRGLRPSGGDLLRAIMEEPADFLRRATDEALAYLQWVGRFAEAREKQGGGR